MPAGSGELAARVAALDLAEDESAYRLIAGSAAAFVHRMTTAAKSSASLDLQYYLWHDDLTGRLLAGELLAAAERGVRIRVLIDDLQHRGMAMSSNSSAAAVARATGGTTSCGSPMAASRWSTAATSARTPASTSMIWAYCWPVPPSARLANNSSVTGTTRWRCR